jgi:pilus assembly protein CpaB
MRALSLRVNEVVGVAGFVLPGMRVDVLLTGSPSNSGSRVTRTILQNVLVLSAGQQLESNAQGQAMNVRVVTLLVSPGQAETLTLASNEGSVQLVLRNGSDTMIAETEGAARGELYGTRQAEPPQPAVRAVPVSAPPPPPAPPPPDQIEVFRGTQRSVVEVNPAQERY